MSEQPMLKTCDGCARFRVFFDKVDQEQWPEIKHDWLCVECYDEMKSLANDERRDVDNCGEVSEMTEWGDYDADC